mgnify:CR=1 FL=1
MANRYFFDKRDIKHFLIKYGIMLLISVPILIGINILFGYVFKYDNMVFLDIVFLCVIFVVGELICYLVKQKKEKNTKGEK